MKPQDVDRRTFIETIHARATGRIITCTTVMPEGADREVYPASYYSPRARRTLDEATHVCIGSMGDMLNDSKPPRPYRSPKNVVDLSAIQIDDIGTKGQGVLPIQPSIAIETKPGNSTWIYLLDRPVTPEEYIVITESIKKADYGDPNCGDPQRLVRLPGSKPLTKEYAAQVILWEPDKLFDPDTLLDDLAIAKVQIENYGSEASAMPAPPGVVVEDKLFDWLQDNGWVRSEDTGGFYLITCPWAHTHSDKRDIAKYKPATEENLRRVFHCWHTHGQEDGEWGERHGIQAFIDKMVEDHGAPRVEAVESVRTLAMLGDLIGATPETAALNPTRQAQAAHEQVEAEDPPMTLTGMLERYVWYKPKGLIIDLADEAEKGADYALMTERGVVGAHPEMVDATTPAGNPTRISIVKAWIAERHKMVTSQIPMLDPRRPPGFSDGVVNTYRPFEAIDTDESADPFLRLVRHVAPDDADYLLDWIAYKVQHPWARMVAVVSYTPQFGTGRNALFDLVRDVLGARNCTNIDASRLFGEKQDKFNSHLMHLMVTLGEVDEGDASGDRRVSDKVFNRLKEMVDPNERTALIERKGVDGVTVEIFTSFMIATNAGGGLPLNEGDRRFSVLRGNDVPLRAVPGNEDLVEVGGWLDRARQDKDPHALSAVWHMLMQRDVSQFNPDVVRHTTTKDAMINDRKNDIDLAIEDVLEEWPVFTTAKLVELVRARPEIMLDHDRKDVRRQVEGWARRHSTVPPWVDNSNNQVKVGGKVIRPRVRMGNGGVDEAEQRRLLERFEARTPTIGGENITPLKRRDD